MKLVDKIAIVTGGAMGNGKGIVDIFLKYGAKVCVLDYSDEINNLSSEIDAYKVDIRNKVDVIKAVIDIYNKYKKIDILVNNAGVCKLENFIDMDDELRDFHFDINIKGTWNVTKAVLPYMIKNNSGAIINLSSVTGEMVADSGEVAYATTKAALIGFTKSLAREVIDNNIRVNAILPGYIRTPMVDKMAKETNPNNPEEVIDGIANAIPIKRLGKTTEIGELAAFLACEESSYITGTNIVIDGGSTLPETLTMGV